PTNSTSASFSFSSDDPNATFECQLDSGSFASFSSPETYSSLADGSRTPPVSSSPSDDPSATFECQLDSGSFASCSSPKTYSSLSEGSHTFQVRATDRAGNTDQTPATRTWTVDTTAPQTTIDSGPSDPTNSMSATFTFSSSEPGSTFECKLDSGSFGSCSSP